MGNLQEYKKASLLYDIKYYLSTYWKGYPKELWYNVRSLWKGKQQPKNKFVIFSTGRSGSTLLLSLLNSNEKVFCDGELLKHQYFFPKRVIDLQSNLYGNKIYGFKLLTHHIKDIQPDLKRDGNAFLKELVADGYKILYLERENRLNQTLSMMYAILRNDWHKQEGKKQNKKQKLHIDIKALDWWINGFEGLNEYEHKILEGVDHLHIVYENDLADNAKHDVTMQKVCNFLDIPLIAANTDLRKITPKHFSSYVENVDELITYLKGTKFAHYVSDYQLSTSKVIGTQPKPPKEEEIFKEKKKQISKQWNQRKPQI